MKKFFLYIILFFVLILSFIRIYAFIILKLSPVFKSIGSQKGNFIEMFSFVIAGYIFLALIGIYLFLLSYVFPFLKKTSNIYNRIIFFFLMKKTYLRKSPKRKITKVDLLKGESIEIKKGIRFYTNVGTIDIDNPNRGILIIGGAGSGKTESFAKPILKECALNAYTGICFDFKFPVLTNEVESLYNKYRPQIKHYILNPSHPKISHRVNPLNPKYIPYSAYAREYAQTLVNNLMKESVKKVDFWTRSSIDLLTACIWFLKEEHPKICDLPHVLSLILNNHKDLVELLSTNRESGNMIYSLKTAIETDASEQIAGVVSTLQGAISQINNAEFMYCFGADDFDLNLNSKDTPGILSIASNPLLSATLSPLCGLVISVATKMMNQPDRLNSVVLLDELPTIYIPNLEQIPNTGRSNGIASIFMIQDLSQLVDNYGKEKADVLFASCNNHFYGRVASSHTADVLTKQFGKEDRYFDNSSSSGDIILRPNITKGKSIQERDVIKSTTFMNLNVGEFIGRTDRTEHFVRANFKMINDKNSIDISEKFQTTDNQIKNYYNTVQDDIEQLFKDFKDSKNNIPVNKLEKKINEEISEEGNSDNLDSQSTNDNVDIDTILKNLKNKR